MKILQERSKSSGRHVSDASREKVDCSTGKARIAESLGSSDRWNPCRPEALVGTEIGRVLDEIWQFEFREPLCAKRCFLLKNVVNLDLKQ